jgi:hypothetical protein
MNINYFIYRIFETKWKRKIFDEAIEELRKSPKITYNDLTLEKCYKLQTHIDKSTKLMDLIL